jgi:Cu(I)/Ag(I) efflux system membrane protein CusA/SilA
MLSMPFALVGGIWLMYLLDYNMSIAVGVGFIALAGLAAETGVVMLTYLQQSVREWRDADRLHSRSDLLAAILEGASLRVRPVLMTVASTIGGLMPIMWSTGTGSQVMKRIAAPMVGGLVSAIILTLLVIPVLFAVWQSWEMRRELAD